MALAIGFMGLEFGLSHLAHRPPRNDTHDYLARKRGVVRGGDRPESRTRRRRPGLSPCHSPSPIGIACSTSRSDQLDRACRIVLRRLNFLYYWQHRASHRIRWMWATHAVHHSPTRLNLTAAIRLGWTGTISGNFLFFLPLAFDRLPSGRDRRDAGRQSSLSALHSHRTRAAPWTTRMGPEHARSSSRPPRVQ